MADLRTDSPYEKYAIRQPDMTLFPKVKGREPIMTYLNNQLYPNVPYHIDLSFITSIPEPHIFEHAIDYDRVLIHWGTDHKYPQNLGATLEYYVGGQRIEFSNTTSMFIPRGTKIGPVNWLKVDRPHIMMEFILGTGDSSILTDSGIFTPKDGIPEKVLALLYPYPSRGGQAADLCGLCGLSPGEKVRVYSSTCNGSFCSEQYHQLFPQPLHR
jgi:hypothetical protein